jgi:hypothetical protein
MANIIPKTVKETVMGSKDAKIQQLEANIQEPTKDSRITSDYGVKQSNTDDWLRVNSNDQIGPSLLEDNFGREKVCRINKIHNIISYVLLANTGNVRSIASTMNVFLSVSSTPEALARSAPSSCSNRPRMSRRRAC